MFKPAKFSHDSELVINISVMPEKINRDSSSNTGILNVRRQQASH